MCKNDQPADAVDVIIGVLKSAALDYIKTLVLSETDSKHATTAPGSIKSKPSNDMKTNVNDGDFDTEFKQIFDGIIKARKNKWDFGYENIGSSSMPPDLDSESGAIVHDLAEGDVCVMVKKDGFVGAIEAMLSTITGSFPDLKKTVMNTVLDQVKREVATDHATTVFQEIKIQQQYKLPADAGYGFVSFHGYVVYTQYTSPKDSQKYVAVTPVILAFYSVKRV